MNPVRQTISQSVIFMVFWSSRTIILSIIRGPAQDKCPRVGGEAKGPLR